MQSFKTLCYPELDSVGQRMKYEESQRNENVYSIWKKDYKKERKVFKKTATGDPVPNKETSRKPVRQKRIDGFDASDSHPEVCSNSFHPPWLTVSESIVTFRALQA